MSVMDDIIKKMENMVEMEENHASSLSKSVEGLNNLIVKEILRSIAYDSQKHAGLYTAILSLLKKEGKALDDQEYDRIKSVIKKHIEVESRMVQEAKRLLETERDARIKHLMMMIYDDEVRHHNLMKNLLEAVIRKETILEEDVWDMIWRDVPGHGAPPG
jgi:rubrerythrin